MKAVIVHNSQSGGSVTVAELRKLCQKAGFDVIASLYVSPELDEDLGTYIKQKNVVVIGYGGDGTMSRLASILANTNVPLAPLPGGTLNHFTKDLGINQDIRRAIEQLRHAKPRKIDVGCVNDRMFLNNSSIGLYPSSLQMRDEIARKPVGKWPAAVIASFKAFWRYRSYHVTIDGESFKTPFIFVGNNDYDLERNLIGQRKRLDEGILSVYTVTGSSRWHLLLVFLNAVFHRLEALDTVKIWKAQEITIQTRSPRVRISRDGEHEKIKTPLEYKILKGALKVIGSS